MENITYKYSKISFEGPVIDKIIKESNNDSDESFRLTAKEVKKEIITTISEMKKLSQEEIKQNRYVKFRNMSEFKII